jgi:hypothetical protein
MEVSLENICVGNDVMLFLCRYLDTNFMLKEIDEAFSLRNILAFSAKLAVVRSKT